MKEKKFYSLVLTLSVIPLILITNNANAWIANGVVICTAIDDQQEPQICSDGKGGAIITWFDFRNGLNYDIYAQRIDSNGNVQWEANGTAICTADDNQQDPQICTDGKGGAIITWMDESNGFNYDIYAQRINANGDLLWEANGTAICTEVMTEWWLQICTDGKGGAIITWLDSSRDPYGDIYAQLIDFNGVVRWTANGTEICAAPKGQSYPQICSDGDGGAIITWLDRRSDSDDDIYAQRIDSNGNVQWEANGTAICTADDDQQNPQICTDGKGGAIITWMDERNGSYSDIYAQHIDSNGNVQWEANGTAICTADDNQQDPQICTDGLGGAIITWFDFRNGLNYDIYAQHINSNGDVLWEANGTIICNIYLSQRFPQICTDGKGGAIITWFDNRRDPYGDIYAQHIDSNGAVRWKANGTEICIAIRNQLEPQICTDGEGGAIITWFDRRSGLNYDIYAQRIKNVIGGRVIPLGNFYLLFIIISLFSLIIIDKHQIFHKSKLQA